MINKLHRSSIPVDIDINIGGYGNIPVKHINNHFICLTEDKLIDCIEAVIDFCKSNTDSFNSVSLEFNGVINRIESHNNPKELEKNWYN